MQKRIRRLQQQMHRLYPKQPITQNLQDENENTDFAEPDLQKLLAELYRQGWDGKTLCKKRIQATAKILSSAPEMQELSGELRGQFSNNIYHFSAAKNYHELRELSEAVYDPNTGQKKSFKQFKAVAENINQQYNKVWLKTEQNLAYGATLMAKKWESFEEEEMLQYKTQGDGAVRDSHRALHNIIKPKNDPFWNSCYPPNGWGCRCNVIATNSEEETKHTPPITEKVVPQMFRNNSAKQGKKVKLLPIVNSVDFNKFRNKVLPNVKVDKNPDLLINNEYWEVKEMQGINRGSINRRIKTAKTQADNIVLVMPTNYYKELDRYIKERAKELKVNVIIIKKVE